MKNNILGKWFSKFREIPSLAAIANEEEGQMLIRAAHDDSIKSVTVQGATYNVLSAVEPDKDYAYDSIDEEIDIIFNFVDWMLLNEHYCACNDMLNQLSFRKMHTALLIAFLTITAAAKNHLPDRQQFFDRANIVITQREGEQKTKRLLDGLE